MPALTATELKRLLMQERKATRLKAAQSAFMNRSRSIYGGQVKRAAELGLTLPYTLDEFRRAAQVALDGGVCCYCHGQLKVKTLTADHAVSIAAGGSWSLDNIAFCCTPCNLQKGKWTAQEFRDLMSVAATILSPASMTDLRRRLTIGGKWSPR